MLCVWVIARRGWGWDAVSEQGQQWAVRLEEPAHSGDSD